MIKGLFNAREVGWIREVATCAGADCVLFVAETSESDSHIMFRYGNDWEVWRVDV